MPDLSEQYVFLRGEVQGKRKLDANVVNPLLRAYRKKLEEFKIEEKKSDGKLFKIWTQHVDEFNSELLSEKTLLFSHQLKLNIFDPHPHSHNNYAHSIQVKLAEGLRKIRVEDGKGYYGKIIILTTGIKFSGSAATGSWPVEPLFRTQV